MDIVQWFRSFGIDIMKMKTSFRNLPRYLRDHHSFQSIPGERMEISGLYPCLTDFDESAGVTSGHYFHQDLWAAKRVHEEGTKHHIDIGSRIDGFVAHLLPYCQVTIVDIRNLDSPVPNLGFIQADATDLNVFANNSVSSLSSLHTAEHLGLGRYGDSIEPNAHIKFMSNLQRVLEPGGNLYFSVPCGRERVEFNAHRVFSPKTILKIFDKLEVTSINAVLDDGDFYEDVVIKRLANQEFGLGLFEFTKDD